MDEKMEASDPDVVMELDLDVNSKRLFVSSFIPSFTEGENPHVCDTEPCTTAGSKCKKCGKEHLPQCLFTAKPDYMNVTLRKGETLATCLVCRLNKKWNDQANKKRKQLDTEVLKLSSEEAKTYWEKLYLSGHNVRLIRTWVNRDGSKSTSYKCFCHPRYNIRKKQVEPLVLIPLTTLVTSMPSRF